MEIKCNPVHPTLHALLIDDTIKVFKRSPDISIESTLEDEWVNITITKELFKEQNLSKCFEWCPSKDNEDALAVGFNNGKVAICWPEHHLDFDYTKEFNPRFPRPCTDIAWNSDDDNLLACGFERHRSDASLFIWDINVKDFSNVSEFLPYQMQNSSPSPAKSNVLKSHTEFGYAESVNSLMWLRKEPSTLIAGMNNKTLKTYDIRTALKSNTAQSTVTTKAVFGVCQDPFMDKRLASFFENQVYVWDTRNFVKPVAHTTDLQHVVKIAWCPSRNGFLASLSNGISNGRNICIYDMKHANTTGSERAFDISYYPLEQIITPFETDTISTFCWNENKSTTNHILSVSKSGLIKGSNVNERVVISWNKSNEFLSTIHKPVSVFQWDGSTGIINPAQVKERAISNYGKTDLDKFELENDHFNVKCLWRWVDKVNSLEGKQVQQENSYHKPPTTKPKTLFFGLNYIMKMKTESRPENFKWFGIPEHLNMVYTSPVRSKIMTICDWFPIIRIQQNREDFRMMVVQESDVCRAAALALWHLDLELAIKILTNNYGSNSNSDIPVMAMALCGYTGDRRTNSSWKSMCTTLQYKLSNPYLKAMCNFLVSQPNSGLYTTYKTFLEDNCLQIKDRVGFACLYLSDVNLQEYMFKLTSLVISNSNLEGVLLTGLSKDYGGIELLESYVNTTSDIQTAILAILHTENSELLKNTTVQFWLEEYKSMLSAWKLWKESAAIRVKVKNIMHNNQSKITKDITVTALCNYCQKTIERVKFSGRGRGYNMPGQKANVCSKCQKPLPRCSVCALHPGNIDKDRRATFSSNLITWCQKCKHAGHAAHLEDWFQSHKLCPVSGCECRCKVS